MERIIKTILFKTGSSFVCRIYECKWKKVAMASSDISTRPPKSNCLTKSSIPYLKRLITSKFYNFDIKGVVRLFSSENDFASMVPNTVSSLRSKHPMDDPVSDIKLGHILTAYVMSESSVKKAILCFPNDSGAGPDLLRPQHLRDIL